MNKFTFTPEQKDILSHEISNHARVLAGPGTGKSMTMVALVDQWLSTKHPPRIRLLTFTRAATGELAKKVLNHPAAAAERPSTIHSFAISVLFKNLGVGEFPNPLRIADDWEKDQIVYPTLARRIGVQKRRLEKLFFELSANWESLEPEENPRIGSEDRARFLGGWQEHREVFGYTLLAELPYALRGALLDHPDIQGIDYDILIVDEYQDLNACDLEVLRLIAKRGCAIIGVGDDDQSIYSFRRAAPEGIRRFSNDYPGCNDYPLSVSHRCCSDIIEWATFIIEGDPDRPRNKSRLKPSSESLHGEVALLSYRGGKSEAKGIAKLTHKLIKQEGIAESDILILLRSDHLGTFSKPIRDTMEELKIPCSNPEHVKNVLGETNNRQMLSTLRLVVHRTDSLAWASLLKLQRGIGDVFLEKIYHQAKVGRKQLGEILLKSFKDGFPECPPSSTNRARKLIGSVLCWLEELTIPQERSTGWGKWILNVVGADPVPAPSKELGEILLSLDDLSEQKQSFERYLSQVTPLAKDLAQTESEGVRIMSISASKGLTAEATIIAGLEHGLIPRPEADQAEERRLLYVAMTRATKILFGTWARQRKGPTARAGRARIAQRRNLSLFLQGGPVKSQDGEEYLKKRWN